MPFDRKHTRAFVTDLLESTSRQVNGIGAVTSGAFIRHFHGDALAICGVGDEQRPSANALAKQCRIDGANQVGILMYRAASTGNAILKEKSAVSLVHITATATITAVLGGGRLGRGNSRSRG